MVWGCVSLALLGASLPLSLLTRMVLNEGNSLPLSSHESLCLVPPLHPTPSIPIASCHPFLLCRRMATTTLSTQSALALLVDKTHFFISTSLFFLLIFSRSPSRSLLRSRLVAPLCIIIVQLLASNLHGQTTRLHLSPQEKPMSSLTKPCTHC